MHRGLCQLHHAKKFAGFQQLPDAPCSIRPCNPLRIRHIAGAFPAGNPNAGCVVPRAVRLAHVHHAESAVINPRKALGNGFRRKLLGKVRRDLHPMVCRIAAAAQKLIHHFLRYRKSEGCLRTLRLKIVHQLNLLVFCRQEKTHLLQLRRITA